MYVYMYIYSIPNGLFFLNNIAPLSVHKIHFSTKSHCVNNGHTAFARYVT